MLADRYIAAQLRGRPSLARSLAALRRGGSAPDPKPRKTPARPAPVRVETYGEARVEVEAKQEAIATCSLKTWRRPDVPGEDREEREHAGRVSFLLSALPPPDAVEYVDAAEKAAALQEHKGEVGRAMGSWALDLAIPIDEQEATKAGLRGHMAIAAPYGPEVTRLVRYLAPGGGKVDRVVYGRLSAFHRLFPDAQAREAIFWADLTLPDAQRTVARMDVYPSGRG